MSRFTEGLDTANTYLTAQGKAVSAKAKTAAALLLNKWDSLVNIAEAVAVEIDDSPERRTAVFADRAAVSRAPEPFVVVPAEPVTQSVVQAPPPEMTGWGSLASNYPLKVEKQGVTFWGSGEGKVAAEAVDAALAKGPRDILKRINVTELGLVAQREATVDTKQGPVTGEAFSLQIPLRRFDGPEARFSDQLLLEAFFYYTSLELNKPLIIPADAGQPSRAPIVIDKGDKYATRVLQTVDFEQRPVMSLMAVRRQPQETAVPV